MSDTEPSPLASLPELFERSVARAPQKLAVADHVAQLSYEELRQNVQHGERALRARDLAGSVIGVLLPSSVAYVASILTVTSMRGVFASLEVAWPDPRLAGALQLARPAALLVAENQAERVKRLLAQIQLSSLLWIVAADGRLEADASQVVGDGGAPQPRPLNDLSASWHADSLYLVHTSGSTGIPNAVEGAHRSLAYFIAWQARTFSVDASCRVAQLAPTSFDVSLRDIFLPLATGGTIFVPSPSERYHPILFPKWIAKHQVNLIHAVPSAFKLAAQAVEANASLRGALASVRRLFLSGERLYVADAACFYQALPPEAELFNFYGPSECTLIKSYHRVPRDFAGCEQEVVPIGRAVTECRVRVDISDPSADARGEIVLESPYLAKGYFRNAALTAEKFSDVVAPERQGWRAYRTGDLGFFDEAGVLHFAGRRDHQVKISGNRVELGDVESCARKLDGIDDAVITADSKTGREQELTLSCVYISGSGVSAEQLRAHLRGHLPSYMVPAEIVAWPSLPLLPNGKADRKQIAALLKRIDDRRSHGD